jgi:cytidine deaminase
MITTELIMESIKYGDLSEIEQKLVETAINSRAQAYANYSKFKVGAAALDENKNIHRGCNIESADYTLTTHAEMLAIDNLILSGAKTLNAIAIALSSEHGNPTPCGLCRQKMTEFGSEKTQIICVNLNERGEIKDVFKTYLGALLPFAFSKESLNS